MRIRPLAANAALKRRLAPAFVLPTAATISLVIALLVGGALEFVTAKTQDMARIRDHAQALTVLRSAHEHLILLLLGSDRSGVDATWQDNLGEQLLGLKENRIFFDGTPVVFTLQGREISARVLDESGLAGLNALTVDELDRFLRLHGVAAELARRLTQEVADFKDNDDDRREYGAEVVDYQRKGLRGPKNRAFNYAGEFGQLYSHETFQTSLSFAMLGQLSFSPESQINIDAASRELLIAVFRLSDATVDKFIADRRRQVISISDFRIYSNSIDGESLHRLKSWPSKRMRLELTDVATGTPYRRTVNLELTPTGGGIGMGFDASPNAAARGAPAEAKPAFEIVDMF